MKAGALWLLLVCSACAGKPVLGTLEQKSGDVERDRAAALGAWQAAPIGASFGLGDGVRTLAGASASILLDDQSRLTLGAATTIRFSATAPADQSHAFDVQTGAASLEAADEPLWIQTRVGRARIERRSRVSLTPAGTGLRFEVRVGKATLGDREPLLAGAAVEVAATGEVTPADPRDALARANLALADPTGTITATVRGRGASLRTGSGWSPLAEGSSELASGSELETSSDSSIEIRRGGQRATLGAGGHYLIGPGSGALVSAQSGSIAAGGSEVVRVEVPGGVITIAPEGRVQLSLGPSGTELVAEALDALVDARGERRSVQAGGRARLEAAGKLELGSAGRAGAEPPPEALGDAVRVTDLVLEPGSSATIHDPAPPSAVRFDLTRLCSGSGTLELSLGRKLRRAGGTGSVALLVPAGNHRYTLRCSGERAKAQGQLTVLADAATRSIAAKPPTTELLADGRKYTVLYQNRLPAIRLLWPRPTGAKDLRLFHEFQGARATLPLAEPRYEFASGQLAEGRHSFYFQGGGGVSRQTAVDIRFDNAAPRASLNLPPVLPARPGELLTVSGTALPGSEVWVEDQRAPLDARGRFSVSASLPAERRALAIKLVQPGRGTHYYLRRGRSE